jgi:hypothetical protein
MLTWLSELMAAYDAMPLGNGVDFALAAALVLALIYWPRHREGED